MYNPKDIAKNLIQFPFANGGYPRFAIADDGGALCHKCCKDELEIIEDAIPGDGWYLEAVTINWEDEHLYCDHCGDIIPCAYPSDEE